MKTGREESPEPKRSKRSNQNVNEFMAISLAPMKEERRLTFHSREFA
jgi:hypothetical protein